jgi:hypothetical protein
MTERQLQGWLTLGSVVLVAALAVAFLTVIRAALSAG